MLEKLRIVVLWFMCALIAFLFGVSTVCGISAFIEVQKVKSELTLLQFDYYSGALKELNKQEEVGDGR